MLSMRSTLFLFTSSATADGVGARRSATKSAMVKSISWPTADIPQVSLDLYIALATISSIKCPEVFRERRRVRLSRHQYPQTRSSLRLPLLSRARSRPNPGTGFIIICTLKNLRLIIFSISLIAAPVEEGNNPDFSRQQRNQPLSFGSNNPSFASFSFNCSKASWSAPMPRGSRRSITI